MILHITFTDGSNPVVFTGTPKELAKEWKMWEKWVPEARCLFFCKPGGLQCRAVSGGGYAVASYFDGCHKTKLYTYLLPALKSVEKGAHE